MKKITTHRCVECGERFTRNATETIKGAKHFGGAWMFKHDKKYLYCTIRCAALSKLAE